MNLRKNWFWYLLVAGLVVTIYFDLKRNSNLDNKINELQNQNHLLHIANIEKYKALDSLQGLIKDTEKANKNLSSALKNLKNKRDEIPSIVSDFNELKLDSILTNHRHIKGN